MLAFIARRLVLALGVLVVGTFIAYTLIALSGDPLQDLRESTDPNREQLIAARVEQLDLETPIPLRYLKWMGGAAQCVVPFVGTCDLGQTIRGQDVTFLLGDAMVVTLQLILAATVAALVIGVLVGIVTALRQYSRLDYAVTLVLFVFISLPVFWFAVLLKEFIAIDINNWLRSPSVSVVTAAMAGAFVGLLWASVLGGDRRRQLTSFTFAFVVTAGALLVLSATGWFASPALGPVVVGVLAVAAAVGLTALLAGFAYRNVLYAALVTAVVGIVANLTLGPVLWDPTWGTIALLALATVVVSGAIGYALGGLQRRQAITASIWTGLLTGLTISLDRMFTAYDNYFEALDGRPIATFGARTPNYDGGYWGNLLDAFTHLLLPTLALILISVAVYSRYTRSSMLEVMNQDYVRTARAKGLSERAVIVRHAFRNGLIPITTLVAFDFAGLVGGSIIVERVFAWQGMGTMFITALEQVDPNPAMAFFLVTGVAAVLLNLAADISYAYLDPRIRLS